MMQTLHRQLKRAILCLRISTILYVLISLGSMILLWFLYPFYNVTIFRDPEDRYLIPALVLGLSIFSLAVAVFIEIIIRGLRRRRFWAWICGLITAGLYIPSLFFILGIFILLGLINEEVSREFRQNQ